MGNMEPEEIQDLKRGDGLDVEAIRKEVITAMKDPSGDALRAIRIKYPFLGKRDTKDLSGLAEGGRIGYANGVGPVLDVQEDDLSISEFMQDQGIPQGQMADLDAVKDGYSDLWFGKPVHELTPDQREEFEILFKMEFGKKGNAPEGVMAAAQGGRIGYANGVGPVLDIQEDDLSITDFMQDQGIPQGQMASHEGNTRLLEKLYEEFLDLGYSPADAAKKAKEAFDNMSMKQQPEGVMAAQGGRIGKAIGGIMDLGGKEKDYRNTGGFVDLGAKEKADDVPARLSVNEFVMTADAVRGMGNGDIDLGAQRMENLMGHMENKGKQGAQEMFNVSERLSEVV